MVIELLTLKSRIVPKLALIFVKLHVPLESIFLDVIEVSAILKPLIAALVDISPSTIVPSAI
jgi:hypothetical protein